MSIKKKSVIILHGIFDPSVFDLLKTKKVKDIFVLEGRPGLEASKNSCGELLKRGMKPTLIADNMAGFLFYKQMVKEVWLSYQSVDGEGALCAIGALILGVLGKKHKVPVSLYPHGQQIKLLGASKDILYFNGVRVAPSGVQGYVPLAERVPTKYIGKVHG